MSIEVPQRIADAASHVSYGASAGTVVVGGFTANELAALGGVCLAFATFIVNWVYRHKHFKLAQAESERKN